MTWVSREEWKARKVNNDAIDDLVRAAHRGVVVHYTASDADEERDHRNCARRVKAIQVMHMDVKGYSDIAYHRLVCRHGASFQGRASRKRGAAQGCQGPNTVLIPNGNERYHAVCFLGDNTPNVDDFTTLAEVQVAYFVTRTRAEWPGRRVLGHREVCKTACPGTEIQRWINRTYG